VGGWEKIFPQDSSCDLPRDESDTSCICGTGQIYWPVLHIGRIRVIYGFNPICTMRLIRVAQYDSGRDKAGRLAW